MRGTTASPADEARERADEGAIEAYLEATAARLCAAGLVVRTARERGVTSRVAENSAEHLARQLAGLAVMASHGRGGVLRWILGSTAEVVLDQGPCPILMVRAGATTGAGGEVVPARSVQHAGDPSRVMSER